MKTLLIGLSLLTLSICAEATPRKVTPTPLPPAPLLEQWCAYFGGVTSAIAADRDRLVPLTLTLSRLRVLLRKVFQQTHYPGEAIMTEAILQMARDLYGAPQMSPAMARHTFEIDCLATETKTQETPALWR